MSANPSECVLSLLKPDPFNQSAHKRIEIVVEKTRMLAPVTQNVTGRIISGAPLTGGENGSIDG